MWHKCFVFLEGQDNDGFSLRLHALLLALTEELCMALQSDPVDKALPTATEGDGKLQLQQSWCRVKAWVALESHSATE